MEAEELQRLVATWPFHSALGLRARDTDQGVLFEATPAAEHSIDGGAVLHGGIVATLLDTAATFALIGSTGDDWSTVDLRIDYLRPSPVSLLEVRGRVIHAGSRFGRASAELTEAGSGRLLATAVGTFVRSS